MKDIARKYTVRGENSGGWSNCQFSTFIMKVEANLLSLTVVAGRDPHISEVIACFADMINDYSSEYGAPVVYSRVNKHRFICHDRMSGCKDIFVEYEEIEGFPRRKFLFHVSCFGKISGIKNCYIYDLLDLCVTRNIFHIDRDPVGSKIYVENLNCDAKECITSIIKPRYTRFESGWAQPGDIAGYVSTSDICTEPKEGLAAE